VVDNNGLLTCTGPSLKADVEQALLGPEAKAIAMTVRNEVLRAISNKLPLPTLLTLTFPGFLAVQSHPLTTELVHKP